MGKTRRAFTVSEKLKVIDWHQANGCVVKKTARQFDLNPKHVRDWLASHSVLLQNDFGNTRNKLRLYSGNRAEWPQVDQAVYQFFMSRRNANVKISDDDLKEFALQRAKDLDYQSFRASNGWLRRWKIRKGVRVRRGAKRTLPVEKEEQLTAFFDAVRTLRAEHDYGDVDILLMHQVTVSFKTSHPLSAAQDLHQHDSPLSPSGSSAYTYAFTISLVVRADGFKYPAVVVFKTRQAAVGSGEDKVDDVSASGETCDLRHVKQPVNVHVFTSEHGGLTPAILDIVMDNLSVPVGATSASSTPITHMAGVAASGAKTHYTSQRPVSALSAQQGAYSEGAAGYAQPMPIPALSLARCQSSSTDSNSSASVSSGKSASAGASSPMMEAHGRRQLLIVDSARNHTTVSCRRAANRSHFDMVVLPDGCHGVLDSTVHTIILKPFKEALQKHWSVVVNGHPLPSPERGEEQLAPRGYPRHSTSLSSPASSNTPTPPPMTQDADGVLSPTALIRNYPVDLSEVSTTQNTPASSLGNIRRTPSSSVEDDAIEPPAKVPRASLHATAFSPSKSVASSSHGTATSEHDADSGSESDSSVLSMEATVAAEDLDSDDERHPTNNSTAMSISMASGPHHHAPEYRSAMPISKVYSQPSVRSGNSSPRPDSPRQHSLPHHRPYLPHSVESIIRSDRQNSRSMPAASGAIGPGTTPSSVPGSLVVFMPSSPMPIILPAGTATPPITMATSGFASTESTSQSHRVTPASSFRQAPVSDHRRRQNRQRPVQVPGIQLVCDIISQALDDISGQQIQHAFSLCGITAEASTYRHSNPTLPPTAVSHDYRSPSRPAVLLSGSHSASVSFVTSSRQPLSSSALSHTHQLGAEGGSTPSSHAFSHVALPSEASEQYRQSPTGCHGHGEPSDRFSLTFSSDLLGDGNLAPWSL